MPDLTFDYVTPPETRVSALAKAFPSLYFYKRMTGIVLYAAHLAKQGKFDDARWQVDAMKTIKVFEEGGVPVTFENLSVLDRYREPAVIIGNHMATTETFALAAWALNTGPLTYVVKRGLVEYPIFKHIMISRDPVVVGREDPRADLKAVMTEGQERLGRGIRLVIFPQKTRAAVFNPDEFNSIGVKLAKRAKVPVIPFACKTDSWGAGKGAFKDYGAFDRSKPVHFALGEPIEVTDNGKTANDACIAFIQKKLADWETWDADWRNR